jgi:hypothetical protein
MNAELIRTEGFGLGAEIELAGVRLHVMDGVSTAEQAAAPGPVADPKFDVVMVEPGSWEQASAANPEREKRLEHQWGWRYIGYGQILATDPVRVDLGILVLELDFSADDPQRKGDYVALAIDRIRLSLEPIS